MRGDNGWLSAETAPKDGTVILADIGYPWAIPAVWNDVSDDWAVAVPGECEVKTGVDRYFECDYEGACELKAWQALPEIGKAGAFRSAIIELCAQAAETQDRSGGYQWVAGSSFAAITKQIAQKIRRLKENG